MFPQASLGIHLHSEQQYDEMFKILDKIITYVPQKYITEEININGTCYTVKREVSHQILFGGDQMTVAQCRGWQLIRINSATEQQKLTGLLPVLEDWHTKVVLLEVQTRMVLYHTE